MYGNYYLITTKIDIFIINSQICILHKDCPPKRMGNPE